MNIFDHSYRSFQDKMNEMTEDEAYAVLHKLYGNKIKKLDGGYRIAGEKEISSKQLIDWAKEIDNG